MKGKGISWENNRIAKWLNIKFPLFQAPMAGGATTPELVAAVANAGGLGSLGAGYMTPDEIKKAIQEIRKLTDQPFSVNLFVCENSYASAEQIEKARLAVQASCRELNFNIDHIHPPYAPLFTEQMEVLLAENVPVFTFTFGVPAYNWIENFKKQGILLIGTATTLAEAKYLQDQRVDAIVAQGSEAGGHRGTFQGKAEDALINTDKLIQLLATDIRIPIIAAGGIMNAEGIITSLSAGAAAIQMGTAFLACHESGIHPEYKKILLNSHATNTTLTRAFSGKLARGINNKFIMRMKAYENDILDYPIQNSLTAAMRKEAAKQNCPDFMAMWAGQFYNLCQGLPVAQLLHQINNEVITLLSLK